MLPAVFSFGQLVSGGHRGLYCLCAASVELLGQSRLRTLRRYFKGWKLTVHISRHSGLGTNRQLLEWGWFRWSGL